jgi:hypothetical protein
MILHVLITMVVGGSSGTNNRLLRISSRKTHIPPHYVVERFTCSSKATRGEDLEVEHPGARR